MIGNYFDIFTIAETKIDSSFPVSQFKQTGYKIPYRLDISDTSGGLLVYVKCGLPSRLLTNFSLPGDVQIIPFELKLHKEKWLVVSSYRPPKQNLSYFLEHLSNLLDFYNTYDRCIITGDFNSEPK